MKLSTNVHLWYNSDYSSHQVRTKICQYNVISHIRPDALDKKYVNHMINTLVQKQYQKDLHILVITNRDVNLYHPELLADHLNILFKVSDYREQSKLSKFICIDILSGQNQIIKNTKRQLLDVAWENQKIHNLHDLGWDLTSVDIFSRSKLTAFGNRKVENQILDIIEYLL